MIKLGFVFVFLLLVVVSGSHGYFLQAICSLTLLVLFLLTAFPISQILAPSGLPALVFAFPVGYIAHSILLAIVARTFGVNPTAMIAYMLVVAGLVLIFRKRFRFNEAPQVADLRILLCWLVAAAATIALPLLQVGRVIECGHVFRAYFNADYFKHLGITATLAQSGVPPANPYLSGNTLHYYWGFYVIVAYWMKLFPSFPLEYLMIQFTMVGAFIFVSSLFVALRAFVQSRKTLVSILPLLLMGGSYEGTYLLFKCIRSGTSWRAFTHYNIDALTRWDWGTPQVDTLYRAMLYAPQHLLALTVVLLSLFLWKRKLSATGFFILYGLIFSTLGFGAVIGAVFIALSGLFLLMDFVRSPKEKLQEVLIAGMVGLFFLGLYLFVFDMFRLQGGAFRFGLVGLLWVHLPGYLVLNWGAILILGLAGFARRFPNIPWARMGIMLMISLLCMHYVKDTVGGSEVTLKLGYLSMICLLFPAAAFLDHHFSRPGAAVHKILGLFFLLLLLGVVTWGMDVYNTQDIHNKEFTTCISKDDYEVLRWMQTNLKPDAVVQDYDLEGEKVRISLIPAFGWHRVYLGDEFHAKAFQVSGDEVTRRQRIVMRLFHERSAGNVHWAAGFLGIQYLLVGSGDLAPKISDLLTEPYFSLAFQRGNASLFRVMDVKNPEILPGNLEIMFTAGDGTPLLTAEFDDNFYNPDVAPVVSRWMGSDGTITFRAGQRVEGILQMTVVPLGRKRHVEFYMNGNPIRSKELDSNGFSFQLPVVFNQGDNELLIRCPEGPEVADKYIHNGDRRRLSLRIRALKFQ